MGLVFPLRPNTVFGQQCVCEQPESKMRQKYRATFKTTTSMWVFWKKESYWNMEDMWSDEGYNCYGPELILHTYYPLNNTVMYEWRHFGLCLMYCESISLSKIWINISHKIKTHLRIVCQGVYESQSGLREESTGTVCDDWDCSSDQGVVSECFHLLQTGSETGERFTISTQTEHFPSFAHLESSAGACTVL